jgi:hypothetical protein
MGLIGIIFSIANSFIEGSIRPNLWVFAICGFIIWFAYDISSSKEIDNQ